MRPQNAVARNRDAVPGEPKGGGRQFKSACSETEGAEPGSTSVDGSYQALSPTVVGYIIRTLLT